MTDAARMYAPLSSPESATAEATSAGTAQRQSEPIPILPVPDDAPPMQWRHRKHGEPSKTWKYRDAQGRVVFHVLRWDFTDKDGKPDKEIRPITFCCFANGERKWWPKGMPAPRPLYGLPNILARPDAPVIVVEGEKASDAAKRLFPDFVATTPPHGAESPHKADWAPLKGRHVTIWRDNDVKGSKYEDAVARLCADAGAASVAVVPVPSEFPQKWDVADALPEGWTNDKLRELLDAARPAEPTDNRRLRAVNIGDFLAMEIPAREMVLGPVLPSQGLAMLYAARGVGKTFAGLGMAYAVATGGTFLRWQAPTPRKVLYVDGEMPARAMQERLAQIVQGATSEPPSADFLRIITPDLQSDSIPDISSAEGQAAIEACLEGVSLVIVDNLSTLCRYGRENEAESWEPMQEWLLSLRRRGIAVLLVHHAGKGGSQRGTSKREDCLDTVICLKRPPDYRAEDGARFEVHLEKARGVIGEDAKPFEARLEVRDNAAVWTLRDIEDCELERVIELTRAGDSAREIAKETDISKSKVNRLQKRAREEGRLS